MSDEECPRCEEEMVDAPEETGPRSCWFCGHTWTEYVEEGGS